MSIRNTNQKRRGLFCLCAVIFAVHVLPLYGIPVMEESRIFADENIELDWQIGYHQTEDGLPTAWYAAVVPGAVQLDVMKAENYKQPWWYADNVLQFDWMEDVWFTYRTNFKKPVLQKGKRVFFCSRGIDYGFKIYLNQKLIWEQEGMFTYVNVDLTDNLQVTNEDRKSVV